MKFSNYLEQLLGSKVKIKILRSLFRFQTKSFSSREMAQYNKISHTAVLRSLQDLQGMNIIRIEKHGKSNVIFLNKESCIYGLLEEFFDEEPKALNMLKTELSKILTKEHCLAIFGSVSSKTESLNSDIDLLIITNNKKRVSETIAENQEKFSKKFGNVISAHVMTKDEFSHKKNSGFVKSIRQNHILIKGDMA